MEPIRQEITTSYDGSGVEAAITSTQDLTEETQEASERASLAAKKSREQETALTQLVREQQAYAEKLEAGQPLDDAAKKRASERAAAISKLAAALRSERDAEQRAAQAVAGLTAEQGKAAVAEQTRAQKLSETKQRLESLVRAQDRYEREVSQGTAATEQTIRAEKKRQASIDRLSRELAEERRIQDRVTESVRRHATAQDGAAGKSQKYGGAVGGLTGQMKTFVGSIVGAGGAVKALQILGEEMDRRIEQTREFAEAQLNLQFLGNTFDEQEREFVGSAAEVAGRSPVEVSKALTEVKSFLPNAGKDEIQNFFLEIAETARTTDASLTAIARQQLALFAINRNAARTQNITREMTVQAGVGDPEILTNLLGKLLGPLTKVGGLNDAQAAGVIAGVTGLDTRSPEEQATGFKTLMLALLGDVSKEQAEIIKRVRIDTTNAVTAAGTLGQAIERGELDNAQLERLVGSEAITTAVAFGDPTRRREFFGKVGAVSAAGDSERDLTGEAIQEIFGKDPIQAANFALKQVEARKSVAESQDIEAIRSELSSKLLEEELRASGVGAIGRFLSRTTNRASQLVGVPDDISSALGASATIAGRLIKNPYLALTSPSEITDIVDAQGRTEEQIENVDSDGNLGKRPHPIAVDPSEAEFLRSAADEPRFLLRSADESQSLLPATSGSEHTTLLREIRDALVNPPTNPDGTLASGGRGGINIHGDVYTAGDPRFDDFSDNYRHA